MHWVRADASDFVGNLPIARSGHTAANVGKSKVVVFGGFADRRFLDDISVYDVDNGIWFTPDCTGSGSDGQVGPAPRAFHVSVAIDCHMFIFGGRSGSKRLGDFWMLDTDIWQWSELTSFGDLPSPREFAAASAIGNRKIVMYGGWDGKKWLSDVYILDTISLEWTELLITGFAPPPRCGHTATMVEKRLLVFGGRGGGGPIMGDLWALKGLIEEENETPGWTQLKLPGQSPSPRCGHSITSGGHYLLVFGGHGTGGWLSRYDIYHNDCIVLDRSEMSGDYSSMRRAAHPSRVRTRDHSSTYSEVPSPARRCTGQMDVPRASVDWSTSPTPHQLLTPEETPHAHRISTCFEHTPIRDFVVSSPDIHISEPDAPDLGTSFMDLLFQRDYSSIFYPGETSEVPDPVSVEAPVTLSCIPVVTDLALVSTLLSFAPPQSHEGISDSVSVQWKHLSTNNEPPPPRAYHSMTCIGARYLLFGGFDGKTTFGDIWWLVPEDDPIARRPLPSPPNISSESKPTISNQSVQSILQVDVVDEVNDKELLELSTKLAREVLPTSYQSMSIQALRKHWKTCVPNSLQLHELSALLRDYQRLIINQHKRTLFSKSLPNASNHGNEIYCFFHVKNASQLRMSDIPKLLFEYQRLISS